MRDGRLFICRTCVRDAPIPEDGVTAGDRLAATVADQAARTAPSVPVRVVECLSGCLNPCNAALRARGKVTIRFSRLGPGDATSLLTAARQYLENPTGAIRLQETTPDLLAKVSVWTPPLAVPSG